MKDKVTRLVRGLGLRRALIGVGLVVVAMLVTPLAFAVTSAGGVINACYQNPTNTSTQVLPLSVVRTDGSDKCPSGYTKLSWNQTGIQGPKGDKGDKGDPGPKGDTGAAGESGPAYSAKGPSYVEIADGTANHHEVATKTVPAGNYAVNAKVTLENIDDDNVANADCQLRAGGNAVDKTAAVMTLGINTGAQDTDAIANSQEVPLQAALKDFGGERSRSTAIRSQARIGSRPKMRSSRRSRWARSSSFRWHRRIIAGSLTLNKESARREVAVMKRIIMLLAVVALMVAMMLASAVPGLAAGYGGSGEKGNPDKGIINSGGGGAGAGGGGGIHTAERSDGSSVISGGSSDTGGGTCRFGVPGRQGCTGG